MRSQKNIGKVDIIVRGGKDGNIRISAHALLESASGGRDRYIYSHNPTESEKGAVKSIVRALAETLGIEIPEWAKQAK